MKHTQIYTIKRHINVILNMMFNQKYCVFIETIVLHLLYKITQTI